MGAEGIDLICPFLQDLLVPTGQQSPADNFPLLFCMPNLELVYSQVGKHLSTLGTFNKIFLG